MIDLPEWGTLLPPKQQGHSYSLWWQGAYTRRDFWLFDHVMTTCVTLCFLHSHYDFEALKHWLESMPAEPQQLLHITNKARDLLHDKPEDAQSFSAISSDKAVSIQCLARCSVFDYQQNIDSQSFEVDTAKIFYPYWNCWAASKKSMGGACLVLLT